MIDHASSRGREPSMCAPISAACLRRYSTAKITTVNVMATVKNADTAKMKR